MQKPVNLALSVASLAGIVVAIWAHVVSMLGTDPQARMPRLWIVQMLLFALLVPVIIRVMRRGIAHDPFDIPRRTWRALYGLLVYYAIHFYFFLMVAPENLRSDLTWRMFSAGWILLFSLTATFYWARFAE